jgi:hypothetical protein
MNSQKIDREIEDARRTAAISPTPQENPAWRKPRISIVRGIEVVAILAGILPFPFPYTLV